MRTSRGAIVGVATLAIVLGFGLAAYGNGQEVCPDPKIESVVDGDIDDVVLPAGTEACIKGSTVVVYVTADGESTLRELLGIDKNVSHYGILSTTTTTEATTTTIADTTTTTVEATTTTAGDETTTTPQETTSTTVVDTTTTVGTPDDPGNPELPFTGINYGVWLTAALGLMGAGGLVLRSVKGDE